jgi:hypothetical protein
MIVSATAITPADSDPVTDPRTSRDRIDQDRRRFSLAVSVALTIVTIPYLWILWDLWSSSANPLRQLSPDNFYDIQARAMLAGHLYLPNGSIGIEAFNHNGHQYTYFGIFPSLIRLPILIVTHSFDGRLTAPSLLLAWFVTGIFSSLLIWRLRVMIRDQSPLGRAEAASFGILAASITGGSVLLFLAASPKVANEDMAWGAALCIASIFALLGVLERPTGRRVLFSGVLILLTTINRAPTGYACIIGALLVAGWFGIGREGAEGRRWCIPMLLVGLVPLGVVTVVNLVKFGGPLGFSEASQVWTSVNAHRRVYLKDNGGSAFSIHFLPSTLVAYLQPNGVHLSSVFPFISLPTEPARAVGKVVLDEYYPTASLPASMPLLFLLSCWGLVTAFRPNPVGRVRATRILLVAAVSASAGVLLIGYIAERYLADFLPFLALASAIGLIDIWRRLERKSLGSRGAVLGLIAAVGLYGVWANVGAAITPTALWTSTQAKNFVSLQESVSGGALKQDVMRGSVLPYWAPAGTLFVVGDCDGLYVSTGFSYSTIPGQQIQHETWIPVEYEGGTNLALSVVFNRSVDGNTQPVTIMKYGGARLDLVPTGPNQVRLELKGSGAPSNEWPPPSTGTVRVVPHKPYRMTATIDPNLNTIVVSGLGANIEHYIPGKGPAIVPAPVGPSSISYSVRANASSEHAPSMALCKQISS